MQYEYCPGILQSADSYCNLQIAYGLCIVHITLLEFHVETETEIDEQTGTIIVETDVEFVL